MVDSIAVRPLVIGNSVVTLNPDKKTVHIKSPDGEKDLNGEEFRKYLLANVPKANAGDTVSFKGENSDSSGGGEVSGSVACREKSSKIGPSIFGVLLAGGIGDVVGHFGVSRYVLGDKLIRAEKVLEKTDKESIKKIADKLKSDRTKISLACAAGVIALYTIGKMFVERKKETE